MNTIPRTPDSFVPRGVFPSRQLLRSKRHEAVLNAPPSSSRPSHWYEFLVLPENHVAVRAARLMCRAVLANKRPPANPLVLHGSPGTGKSRLIAAIVHHVAAAPEGKTIRAISVGDRARSASAEESLTDRELFDCDVLVLEDVQHLNDRSADATCELLDHRTTRRRVTIVTANVGPAGLTHLPRRLTSRLTAGLVIQLELLAASSRRAILAEAAKSRGVPLTSDALDWLAEQATGGGVRATLGLLQNLAQVASAFSGPLSRADVEQTLAGTGQPTSAAVDVSTIVKRVAAAFGVSEKEMLSPSRLRGILRPRQIAMYLARELTGLSLPRIGAAFGGRDHTTVLHSCRKVEEEMQSDAALAKRVEELRTMLA